MLEVNAKRLHENPQYVFSRAHAEPVVINHMSHGKMILLSPQQIFSTHRNIDGSVMIHLKSLDVGVVTEEEEKQENGQ